MKVCIKLRDLADEIVDSAERLAIQVDPNTGALYIREETAEARAVAAFAAGYWVSATEVTGEK